MHWFVQITSSNVSISLPHYGNQSDEAIDFIKARRKGSSGFNTSCLVCLFYNLFFRRVQWFWPHVKVCVLSEKQNAQGEKSYLGHRIGVYRGLLLSQSMFLAKIAIKLCYAMFQGIIQAGPINMVLINRRRIYVLSGPTKTRHFRHTYTFTMRVHLCQSEIPITILYLSVYTLRFPLPMFYMAAPG